MDLDLSKPPGQTKSLLSFSKKQHQNWHHTFLCFTRIRSILEPYQTTGEQKKEEHHKTENYRPVSLTSISCKLLEHVVHSTIMDHFDQHHILCDQQHGFRTRISCETQLLTTLLLTLDEIGKNMDHGEQTVVVLLYFSNAFDKVPHKRLLHKMHHYGIQIASDLTLY